MITEIGFSTEGAFIEFQTDDEAAKFCANDILPCGAERWPFGDIPKHDGKRATFNHLSDGKWMRIAMSHQEA